MWFGKNIMTKLGLALAVAVPAFAADDENEAFPLDPLVFPGASDDDAQELWSELMKYKLWATEGFTVGNRLEVKEDKGWVGTSNGDFVIKGPGALVGGPVIIGGDVNLYGTNDAKGTEFLTGPLRVEKNLTLNTESHFYGTVCVQGDTVVPSDNLPWNAEFIGDVYQNIHGEIKIGSEATTGVCDKDKVAFVEKKMTVPSLRNVTYNGNLVANGRHIINVPDEEGPYDLFYESVTINSDSKLHINMPKGGRLTRIFTKSITFGNQAELQVMYDGTLLKNDEYEGMFMVYVDGDIVFENTNDRTLQGTFISSGTITTKCNMKFAGQMIADKIVIGNEIRGDDAFRYVPVVPPVIDIKPTASAMGGFVENNMTVEIPITLSTVTKNGVSFSYCFELSESSAKLDDFNVYPDKDKDGNEYPTFPVCGSCGSNCGTVDIPRNAKEPDKKVYLNVKLDDDGEEPTEKLAMKIYDLNGAVLPKNSNGLFDLNILNVPLFNFGDVDENYYINEHVIAPNDTVAQIPIEGQDLTDFVISMEDNALDEHPIKLNDLFKISIDETQKLVVITVKNHDELNYESDRIKQKYQVTLSLKDKGGVEGCKTVTAQTTINIKDINESPYFVNFGPYEVKEHSPKGTSVGFVLAEDPDVDPAYNTLVYTIPVNEDNDKTNDVPFAINPSTGEITVAEPDKEKFDYETHPLPYVFNVEVFDNLNSVPQEIEISLIDINEPPIVIDTTGDTIWVAENSPVDLTKMAYFEVSDPDADDNANLLTQIKPTITDNKKKEGVVSAEDLFEMVMEKTTDDNGVDKYWAVLKVKADINFEAIMAARGDSVFDVTLTFTDHAGTGPDAKDTSFVKKIAVTDVNEEPYFTAAGPFDVKENSPVGTAVGEVKAADDDIKPEFNTLYYTIPVNEDNDPDNDVPFAIVNKKSGLITVANKEALDFEDPSILEHKFEFKVQVTDGEFVKDTLVTITLKDDDEPPEIISECEGDKCPNLCADGSCDVCVGDACVNRCVENCDNPRSDDPAKTLTIAVKENSATGYEVINYKVRDEDLKKTLKAEIKNTNAYSGADTLFKVKMVQDLNNDWRVVVYVIEKEKLDYEQVNELHAVTIYVYDSDDYNPENPAGLYDSLLRVIKVEDVNEEPYFTAAGPFEVKENSPVGTAVGEVKADDEDIKPEFNTLYYTIPVNEDNDPDNDVPFAIVNKKSGLITVANKEALDFEDPSILEHKFEFKVQVTDGEFVKDTLVTITLKDDDEPPEIISECEGDKCPNLCADGSCDVCVGDACVNRCIENCDNPRSDDPAKTLTIAVKENSATGYEVINYKVRDEDLKKTLKAEIRNTNESGADSLFKAKIVQDLNGDWRVVVYVIDEKRLDYEQVNETHAVTIYVYDTEDYNPENPAGLYDSLLRVIKVVDVNEAPIADDAKFEPDENLPDSAVIGELKVVELDTKHVKEFGHLEYSIIGKDETFVFAMDSNRVIVNAPSKMDYELPVHNYTFDVLVKNCEWNKTSGKYDGACLYDTANVVVNIQDVNEKPKIIIDGPTPDGGDDSEPFCVAHCDTTDRGVWKDSILTVGVKENTDDSLLSKTGMVLFQYHYADEDTGHVAGAKVTWFDAGSTISSVSTKGSDLFNIVGKNGVITVTVNDQKLLDYEKLRNATSRDDPDPEYTMGIVVTDPKGLADTLYRTIRVIDVNEKPLYTAEPCVVVEGNHPGDSIGHVEHPSDIDSLSSNPKLYDNYFKLTDVSHKDLFDLRKDTTDLMRVVLAALDSIDCEDGRFVCGDNSIYWVELTYGDTTLQTEYKNLKIPVTILDSNEAPIIKTDTIGVDENSPKGTPVDSIRWFDYDVFDKEGLHFEISNDPSGCFEIDSKTGFVTVKKDKCAALDHEKNPTLDIEVSATDMVYVTDASRIRGAPNTIKKKITVNVHDVNEPPHLDDTTFTVSEFKKPGTVIDTVVGHDPDTKNPEYSKLTYSMVKGDSSKFKVNPTTGEIVLLDSLDYETKNEYKIDVRVYDGEYDDVATITIKVKNEIEKTHVRIILVDDSAKVWNDPEVVYTNKPGREICWEQERDTVCKNIHITKDTVVTIEFKNPKKDSAGVDKVIIYYSNAAPVVTISAKPTLVSADNIFTILEKTGDDDSTVYVNDVKNNIYITIKDTANKNSKVDTSFAMPISLETVKIENKVYDKVESIIKAGVYLDETKPSKEVTKVPTNGNTVKVSYKEAVGKDTVTVTYETDKKGDVLKSKVIGDDGKEHSWEVITVSYVTKVKINGKEENVTISYLADAATGQVLEQDAEGNLMTATAAEAKRKDAKKNAAKADSTKNKNESTVSDFSTGRFSIAYSYTVKQYVAGELMESSVDVSYVVDGKGELTKNADGDRGYSVKYTYTNIFGNAAEQSLFIVLDQVLPTVEIRSPVDYQEIRSNYVNVEWYVNGKAQDTLTVQGLEKGVNMIVRFYRDKAGNEASDTVFVVMKDSKDIELSVVNPVTEINPDKVAEFYSGDNAKFAPEKGQTYSVSILSTSNKEIETLKGGSFDAKASSGEELYPDQKQKHLGPTLGLKVQLPVVKPDNKSGTVSGLATMDDLMCHGKINLEEVCNENTKTMGVEEYVAKYCDADVSASDDLSSINLYNSRITVKIWIYTSLGGFVDYYRFSHDLNEPDYTNEAGLLQMFFELKPDREGFVRSESGKLYSTGAYLYKVQASVNSVPRCDVMPMKASSHKRGEKIKSSDDLLKPFGYKRPKQK